MAPAADNDDADQEQAQEQAGPVAAEPAPAAEPALDAVPGSSQAGERNSETDWSILGTNVLFLEWVVFGLTSILSKLFLFFKRGAVFHQIIMGLHQETVVERRVFNNPLLLRSFPLLLGLCLNPWTLFLSHRFTKFNQLYLEQL